MQEHIRRAHPEYYLPKLPATKDSFELMISTPPHERPAVDPNHANHHHHHGHSQQPQQVQHSDPSGLSPAFALDAGLNSIDGYHSFGHHDGGYYTAGDAEAAAIYNSMQAQQRSSDEYRRGSLIPAASAAAALAQLHYHRPDSDWGGNDMGQVIFPALQMSPTVTEADFLQNFYADQNSDLKTNHFHVDPALEDTTFMQDHGGFPVSSSSDQPGLLPSSLARSPPDRHSSLPSLQRSLSRQYNRPRKSSLTQQARMAKHERKKSRELAKRSSGGDRKAFSAEPGTASALLGKRWEDLIDAAASATEEEDSRDLTPVSDVHSNLLVRLSLSHKAEPCIDTRITVSVASSSFTDITTTLRYGFAIPIFPGITFKPCANPTSTRTRPGPPTLPISREQPFLQPFTSTPQLRRIYRLPIPHNESQFSHHAIRYFTAFQPCQSWSVKCSAPARRPGTDLLCRLSEAEYVEGLVRVHELHLRALRRVCAGYYQRAEPRADEYVSAVQCYGFEFQAVSVGPAMTGTHV